MAKWTTTPEVGLAVALTLAAGVASAQRPAFPRPSDQDLLLDLPAGASLETRLDGDISGDGIPDVAFVGRTDDERWLVVKIGCKDELDWGHEPSSAYRGLDPHPLGAARLALKKNVLVVEDLTGGTTATLATYRYRWDAAARRMRLIGLDAGTYSRTNSHDSIRTSWNLLTGAHEVVHGTLVRKPGDDGDAVYRYGKPDRTVRDTPPVYMEDTPDAAEAAAAEVVPADEDRD